MAAEDAQESAADPQVLELFVWAGKILYWIVWPIAIALYYILAYLAFAVLFLLKLLYRPLEFVLLPVFYLLRFIGACLLAPFHILARFETLYIYLGIGAIVGCVLGLLLSLVYGVLQGQLGLDAKASPIGRTVKQYRQEKNKQKAKVAVSPGYLSPSHLSLSDESRRSGRGAGVLASAIVEDVDSDY